MLVQRQRAKGPSGDAATLMGAYSDLLDACAAEIAARWHGRGAMVRMFPPPHRAARACDTPLRIDFVAGRRARHARRGHSKQRFLHRLRHGGKLTQAPPARAVADADRLARAMPPPAPCGALWDVGPRGVVAGCVALGVLHAERRVCGAIARCAAAYAVRVVRGMRRGEDDRVVDAARALAPLGLIPCVAAHIPHHDASDDVLRAVLHLAREAARGPSTVAESRSSQRKALGRAVRVLRVLRALAGSDWPVDPVLAAAAPAVVPHVAQLGGGDMRALCAVLGAAAAPPRGLVEATCAVVLDAVLAAHARDGIKALPDSTAVGGRQFAQLCAATVADRGPPSSMFMNVCKRMLDRALAARGRGDAGAPVADPIDAGDVCGVLLALSRSNPGMRVRALKLFAATLGSPHLASDDLPPKALVQLAAALASFPPSGVSEEAAQLRLDAARLAPDREAADALEMQKETATAAILGAARSEMERVVAVLPGCAGAVAAPLVCQLLGQLAHRGMHTEVRALAGDLGDALFAAHVRGEAMLFGCARVLVPVSVCGASIGVAACTVVLRRAEATGVLAAATVAQDRDAWCEAVRVAGAGRLAPACGAAAADDDDDADADGADFCAARAAGSGTGAARWLLGADVGEALSPSMRGELLAGLAAQCVHAARDGDGDEPPLPAGDVGGVVCAAAHALALSATTGRFSLQNGGVLLQAAAQHGGVLRGELGDDVLRACRTIATLMPLHASMALIDAEFVCRTLRAVVDCGGGDVVVADDGWIANLTRAASSGAQTLARGGGSSFHRAATLGAYALEVVRAWRASAGAGDGVPPRVAHMFMTAWRDCTASPRAGTAHPGARYVAEAAALLDGAASDDGGALHDARVALRGVFATQVVAPAIRALEHDPFVAAVADAAGASLHGAERLALPCAHTPWVLAPSRHAPDGAVVVIALPESWCVGRDVKPSGAAALGVMTRAAARARVPVVSLREDHVRAHAPDGEIGDVVAAAVGAAVVGGGAESYAPVAGVLDRLRGRRPTHIT